MENKEKTRKHHGTTSLPSPFVIQNLKNDWGHYLLSPKKNSSFAKNEISNWSSFLIRDYMIVRKTVTCNGRCTYMIRISTAIREDWENRSPFIFCYFSLQTEDDLFYIFFVFIGFLWSSLGLLILSEVGDVKLVGEPLA